VSAAGSVGPQGGGGSPDRRYNSRPPGYPELPIFTAVGHDHRQNRHNRNLLFNWHDR